MGHRVIAPLVQARLSDGGYVHVYAGGSMPADADPDQLDQLVGSGMVVEVEDAEEPAPEPEPAPSRKTSAK